MSSTASSPHSSWSTSFPRTRISSWARFCRACVMTPLAAAAPICCSSVVPFLSLKPFARSVLSRTDLNIPVAARTAPASKALFAFAKLLRNALRCAAGRREPIPNFRIEGVEITVFARILTRMGDYCKAALPTACAPKQSAVQPHLAPVRVPVPGYNRAELCVCRAPLEG